MTKKLSISLLIFAFLSFSLSSYAAFPVKKVINTINNATNENVKEIKNTYEVAVSSVGSGKSQIVAALLCWLVGIIGIHRFYLGYTWQGIVQIITLGGLGIWTLIDLIRIITGDLQPKNGSYDKTF